MSKQIGLFLGIITGVVMLILLAFGACAKFLYEVNNEVYLPGLIDKEYYSSEPGRDSVKYRKYMYEDTKELREKLEYHEKLMPVTDNATEYIASFFENFGDWAESVDFYSEYDLDKSCIDYGDYFYIENVEIHGGNTGLKDRYRTYDVYYFDIQSMTLYYLHIDI